MGLATGLYQEPLTLNSERRGQKKLPMKLKQSGNQVAMSAVQLSTMGRLMEVNDGGSEWQSS